MGEKGAVAEAAELLGAEEREDHGAAGPFAGGEEMSERENRGGAGGVVVGAVVDAIGVGVSGVGPGDAEVVEVGGEEDGLGGIGAAQEGDGVPGFAAVGVFELRQTLLHPVGQGIGQAALLDECSVIAGGLKAERGKL